MSTVMFDSFLLEQHQIGGMPTLTQNSSTSRPYIPFFPDQINTSLRTFVEDVFREYFRNSIPGSDRTLACSSWPLLLAEIVFITIYASDVAMKMLYFGGAFLHGALLLSANAVGQLSM